MLLFAKGCSGPFQGFFSPLQAFVQFVSNALTHLNLKHTRLAQRLRGRLACPIKVRFVPQEPRQLQHACAIDSKSSVRRMQRCGAGMRQGRGENKDGHGDGKTDHDLTGGFEFPMRAED